MTITKTSLISAAKCRNECWAVCQTRYSMSSPHFRWFSGWDNCCRASNIATLFLPSGLILWRLFNSIFYESLWLWRIKASKPDRLIGNFDNDKWWTLICDYTSIHRQNNVGISYKSTHDFSWCYLLWSVRKQYLIFQYLNIVVHLVSSFSWRPWTWPSCPSWWPS